MHLPYRITALAVLTTFANRLHQTSSFSMSMMAGPSPHNTKRRKRNHHPSTRKNHGTTNANRNKENQVGSSPQKKPKVIYSMEQLTGMTLAQAIQESVSTEQLLRTADRMWLPTDEDLAPHLRTQKVHHDKRIKAASQLLQKMGECVGRENGVKFHSLLWTEAEENGLRRAILASAIPFQERDGKDGHGNSEGIDGRCICIALAGVHSIVGFTLPHSSAAKSIIIDADILQALKGLILDADSLAWNLPMYEAIQVRWAIRGILSRLGPLLYELLNISSSASCSIGSAKEVIPNLEERISKLPFDIIPSCLNWDSFDANNDAMASLLNDIPFKIDTITTRDGSKVEERRGTAWIADEGIGALAYSGKLMNPHPLPSIVSKAMRQVEKSIIASKNNEQLELCHDTMGKYFDCALCNHYPNEESACKFHTDPEHGIYWERLTCVVSAGNDDVRKFAFRPIPNENEWDRYETQKACNIGIQNQKDDGILPAVVPLFPGDVVTMDHDCNDVFHHAVYGRSDISASASSDSGRGNGRVSLVFKRAMNRGNGRKGHGRAGQGRRAKKY
jgi:hypothetical protein